jgi:hypothetical protein
VSPESYWDHMRRRNLRMYRTRSEAKGWDWDRSGPTYAEAEVRTEIGEAQPIQRLELGLAYGLALLLESGSQ